ncbi:unnamed protein product, partial [Iphiclides podalirius]
MPPAIAVHITGEWELGWILCDIWISLDILLCTASILSLCAISVDRYLAVTRPLTYEPDHNQGGVCRYNQNPGYVVFSAMGSFFLPMAVMVYVYARISCVVARRHHQLSSSSTKSSKKSKLSCIRTESDSGSDKLSLRQSVSKQPSRNSNQQSECSSQADPKCPCCFNAAKKQQTDKKLQNKQRKGV